MLKQLRHIPIGLVILAIGLALVVVGITQGGFVDVLRKAALICYECIGLG